MSVVLEWAVVISLGTCTQRWILIKFKGSLKFSLEHLGCLWHLIPLWKSTKRWPRMSPKKILMKVSMIFLTQHIVQLGSGVLTCWTFVFWNTFVTMVTSKVKTQFWSNQGEIFFKFHLGCCVCILPILLPGKKMLVSSPTRKSIVVNIIQMTATYLLKPFNFKVFIDFWPWCVWELHITLAKVHVNKLAYFMTD